MQNRGAVLGLAMLGLVALIAIFASAWFEQSPWMMVGQPLLKPFSQSEFLFGTDMLGRDIGVGLAYGARVSLLIGLVSTFVAVCLGIVVGAAAGFYGGWIDRSEEHTSELQSLMRISYAVFCLKKKKIK